MNNNLKSWLKKETSKCMFCGFCEALCPTVRFGSHRGYGPRGRINIVLYLSEEGKYTHEALNSLYSCLLCAACTLKCPANIDIPEVIRVARSLYARNNLKEKEEVVIEKEVS